MPYLKKKRSIILEKGFIYFIEHWNCLRKSNYKQDGIQIRKKNKS